MKSEVVLAENADLSIAWATAMLRLLDEGGTEISPLVVTIPLAGPEPAETPEIRSALDEMLRHKELPSCATTANTIFPQSLWAPVLGRQNLFDRYQRILPYLKKYKANRHGLYFERMTAHGAKQVNQLDHVIRTYVESGNHRRSALQAAIMDPAQDHTNNRQRGFPCLQQVGFVPGEEGLTVTGYYPTQNIFDRAYGNYLGLCRLGHFVAYELGMKAVKLTCFVGVGKIGKATKGDLEGLAAAIRPFVERELKREHEREKRQAIRQATPQLKIAANGLNHDDQLQLQLTEGIHVGTR
jgi:hypothetical protein